MSWNNKAICCSVKTLQSGHKRRTWKYTETRRHARAPGSRLGWLEKEQSALLREGRRGPTSGLVSCLPALVSKCGQKQEKDRGEAATSVYILIKNVGTSSPRSLYSSISWKQRTANASASSAFCVASGHSLLKGGRFQSTYFASQTTLLRDKKANWFEWHKAKTTLSSGMCSAPQLEPQYLCHTRSGRGCPSPVWFRHCVSGTGLVLGDEEGALGSVVQPDLTQF